MRLFTRIFQILAVLISPALARDPMLFGLRGALGAFAPIPEQTSFEVRTTAAELFARYTKPQKGSWLSQQKSGSTRMWMEIAGLTQQLDHEPTTRMDTAITELSLIKNRIPATR